MCALRECGRPECLLCVGVGCVLVCVALPAASLLGALTVEFFYRRARHEVLDQFLPGVRVRQARGRMLA